jgi:Concanavalin A-like lectin/glucanases superfamily/FG-GAP repeat/Bacterial Ig-like domain
MTHFFTNTTSNAKWIYCFLFCFLIFTNSSHAQLVKNDSQLSARDGDTADKFGTSVSMDGNWALIGAPGEAGEGNDYPSEGAAYFYQYGLNGWSESQIIKGRDIFTTDQNFGKSVAISGHTALIGAPGIWDEAGQVRGKSYIYQFDGIEWIESQVLLAGADSVLFGQAVDIEGNYAIIGAPATYSADTGAVYIYEKEGSSWILNARLTADDGSPGDGFGTDVDISGKNVIVGSNNHGAYIFHYNDTSWTEEKHIGRINGVGIDVSGKSVAIYKDRVLIGTFPGDGAEHVLMYTFNGTEWSDETMFYGWGSDFFGRSLALGENIIAIGAYGDDMLNDFHDHGVIHLFRFLDGEWGQYTIYDGYSQGWQDINQYYGYAVDVYKGTVIGGAPLKDSWTGTAYIHELSARPVNIKVSNGEYSNRNKVSWDLGDAPIPTGFKIYREEELIDSTAAGGRAVYDYDGTPGKLHAYGVSAIDPDWGESLQAYSIGWQKPNGKLAGGVQTSHGAGVENVEISVLQNDTPLGTCLRFDGVDDYTVVNSFDNFPSDAFTISFWAKTDDQSGYIIDYATYRHGNTFSIQDPENLNIWLTETGHHNTGATGISINDGQWHHIAITWKRSPDGEMNIFKDGKVEFIGQLQPGGAIPIGNLVFGHDNDVRNGDFNPDKGFEGLLDEVRIWDRVRTEEEIVKDMNASLSGTESGLQGYWSFDDLSGRAPKGMAGDYSKNGGNHAKIYGALYSEEPGKIQPSLITGSDGKFSIENLYYGQSGQFEILPSKGDHHFDPAIQNISLNRDAPSNKSINFVDTTSITLVGIVTYQGTNCPVKDVEIWIDEMPTNRKTNSSGQFTLVVDNPGTYTLTPFYKKEESAHTFLPDKIIRVVEDDILDLQFEDSKKHLLYGKFRGPCDQIIGKAQFVIYPEGNKSTCFRDTIKTDENGNFRTFVPAQSYVYEMINIWPDDQNILVPTLLEYFSPGIIDLTWEDQRKNFIYREEPIIKINGFPESNDGYFKDELIFSNIPILEQRETYNLEIEVLDVWGEEESCPVDQGSITILDGIGDKASQPVTLELKDGIATYDLFAGDPNILSGGEKPFQKLLQIVAQIGEETITKEQWVLVTGHRPRAQTFATTSPELPSLILRDPPGDNSYAYISKGVSHSYTSEQSVELAGGGGGFADVQIGAVSGFSAGLFVNVEVDMGAYVFVRASFMAGKGSVSKSGATYTWNWNEEFKTSGNDQIIGADGDIYIGASYINLYALTDIIKYNSTTKAIERDTSLAWQPDGIKSTFVYTESHIKNTLLPQLKELKKVATSDNDSYLAAKYENSISVWDQILKLNQSRKDRAVDFGKNISFSAGTEYNYTYSTGQEVNTSIEYSQFFDFEASAGFGAVINGVTSEFGIQGFFKLNIVDIEETSDSEEKTYGYVLADDDPGDFFSVNIKRDYTGWGAKGAFRYSGSPVFELVGGTSSCPWEKGTQPRDGVQIGLNKFTQYNISPDEPAAFILSLGNTSQSGEERDYALSVIQSSNLDGAIIRVGGVVIEDQLAYTIPSGEQLKATLAVERGPIAYDYENLKVRFYSPCDPSIADTVTFSVHYISPCSDVNLLLPENNWLVNSADNDSMQVVINNYDLDNPHLNSIKFQYRRLGSSWQTPFIYLKDNLPNEFILQNWSVQNLPDGDYELRAVADCGSQGVKYSAIATGIIDRTALIVFGTPSPEDGVLNIGEDITIAFSGEIDPAFVSENNVNLITADDSTNISVVVAAFENKIIITPKISLAAYEDRQLIATVKSVQDKNGNILRKPESWTFRVNQSPVYWTVPNVIYTVYQGQEDKFTRTLKNAGGKDEGFTITSYPSWLIPDKINGTIPTGGEENITFTINTNLNVASYQDTVNVTTSFGEERLIIVLQVLHKAPQWIVNPAQFTYTMNIVAQISINDTLSKDVYDIISVYAGSEIRGVAQIEQLSAVNKYLAFITVFSNNPQGELLSFHLWDASKGQEYAYLKSDYHFENNSSLGTVSTPIIIEPDANVQAIEMARGWNWFSLNVNNSSYSLNDALASLSPVNGDIISGQDKFSQYDAELGWIGSLDNLEVGKSYHLHLNSADKLLYTGSPVDIYQATLSLQPGWNWIAHMNPGILDVNETLAGVTAEAGDKIKSQTEFADYIPATQTWEGSLKNLRPGEGYMLKLKEGGNLQYPILTKSTTSFPEIPEWEIDVHAYEFSMGLTAAIEFDGNELRDSSLILAAFSDYTCKGITRIKYISALDKYMGFLTIHSNSAKNDSIYFKIYQPADDKMREVEGKILFEDEAHLGEINNPLILKARAIGDELVPNIFYLKQNYPNPFNPETIIEYGLPIDGKVQIFVFNALGQKVAILVNKTQKAKRYKIVFKAANYSLSSGIYFYYFTSGSYTKARKLLFLK